MSERISVVIPCYNGRKYIAETLESVLAQGDAIGEIIVVDDGSTDGSADYVESLGIPGLLLHRLAQNRGIGGARNAGVALTRFPLLAFLDADDLWPPGRCAALHDAMKASGAPWAFGRIEHFISPDTANRNYALPPVQTGYFASAMLARKDFFHTAGTFDEALRVGEFIDWFDRARRIQAAPAACESLVLRRRIHGANSSLVNANPNAQDYLKVARAAIARKKQGGAGGN